MKPSVLFALAAFALSWSVPDASRAALDELELSGDIHLELGGQLVRAGEVARDDLTGSATLSSLAGLLAPGVNVDAFDRLPGGGDVLFSVDVSTEVAGRLVRPADVIQLRANGSAFVWSAPGGGLPPGADIDALARTPDGDLLLSFATGLRLGTLTVDDEDVVRLDLPSGDISLALDASRYDIPAEMDLDGLDLLADGRLLLSFDIAGRVGAIEFSDEDALRVDPIAGTIELAYDGSALHPGWVAADLDALDGSLDPDGDGIADAFDPCPFYAQTGAADTDRDGRGNECECTDQTGDGRNDVADLVAINAAIFTPSQATPLCDGNADARCDVNDIVAANAEIFSPSNTSICARQPFPGP